LADNAVPKEGQPRIGIFLCQCGDEIARVVNLESVGRKAAVLPDVVHTQILPFSCSPEAAATIQAAVTAHQLDRAVLAACSCCSINQVCFSCTFQRVRCKQNLGLFTSMNGNADAPARSARFEFVNLREQCAWVHADNPRAATSKAAALIAASVAALHVQRARPEPPADLSQPRTALILGHGAAAAICRKALEKQDVATVLPP
jgi:heterodisulfide reductase subunit A